MIRPIFAGVLALGLALVAVPTFAGPTNPTLPLTAIYSAAQIDQNFATATYSPALASTVTGAPRIYTDPFSVTTLGTVVEHAVTNGAANTEFGGGVVGGVIGGTNTVTGWNNQFGGDGLTDTITSITPNCFTSPAGVVSSCMRLTITGTATNAQQYIHIGGTSSTYAMAVTTGQKLWARIWIRCSSTTGLNFTGSSGTGGIGISIFERTSSGGYVANTSVPGTPPQPDIFFPLDSYYTTTSNQYADMALEIPTTDGVAVNAVCDIAQPQLEAATYPGSYIATTTPGAASTADALTITSAQRYVGQVPYTEIVGFRPTFQASPISTAIFQNDDGTNANRVDAYLTASDHVVVENAAASSV